MTKRIIVTDTHLGYKKANLHYLDIVYNLFDVICKYANDNGIDELVHLGDFFDNRKNMSLKTLHYALRIGSNVNSTFKKSLFVLGNHDIFYKDRYLPNSHQIFCQFENIDIIDEPTQIGNTLLVPWILEGNECGNFGSLISESTARFCMGHFEMNGACFNSSGTTGENYNMNFSNFSNFEKTLSGHFHTKGSYSHNVEYIGAPFHMDFNDSGSRGFYVFDDETGDLEFVEFNNYPKFVKWEARPDNVFGDEFKGQIVRIVFTEDFGTTVNNQIINDVMGTEPYQVFTEYQFTNVVTDDTVDDDIRLQGVKEIHHNFIKKSDVPAHMNRVMLHKIVDSLYEELNT